MVILMPGVVQFPCQRSPPAVDEHNEQNTRSDRCVSILGSTIHGQVTIFRYRGAGDRFLSPALSAVR
jgi:hypothetical protein